MSIVDWAAGSPTIPPGQERSVVDVLLVLVIVVDVEELVDVL
jgi:hypothetical protein